MPGLCPRRPASPLCNARPHLQVDTQTTFYASSAAGVAGALLTLAFLPDTTGLDLGEIDRMHRFMLAGQVSAGPSLRCSGCKHDAPPNYVRV